MHVAVKFPNPNIQAPEKDQSSAAGNIEPGGRLELEDWRFIGCLLANAFGLGDWYLELFR
jgi:hypothetical protein